MAKSRKSQLDDLNKQLLVILDNALNYIPGQHNPIRGPDSNHLNKQLYKLIKKAKNENFMYKEHLRKFHEITEPVEQEELYYTKSFEEYEENEKIKDAKIQQILEDSNKYGVPIKEFYIDLFKHIKKIIISPSKHEMLKDYIEKLNYTHLIKKSENYVTCPACCSKYNYGSKAKRSKCNMTINKYSESMGITGQLSMFMVNTSTYNILRSHDCMFCNNILKKETCCQLFINLLLHDCHNEDTVKQYKQELNTIITIVKDSLKSFKIISYDGNEDIYYIEEDCDDYLSKFYTIPENCKVVQKYKERCRNGKYKDIEVLIQNDRMIHFKGNDVYYIVRIDKVENYPLLTTSPPQVKSNILCSSTKNMSTKISNEFRINLNDFPELS
jgi:hypothetical protein